MTTIAWIGLGQMGRPMAGNLVRAGHEVRGVEIDPAVADAARLHGIPIAGSLQEALHDAEMVFTMLPSGKHVRELLRGEGGVFGQLGPDAIVVDCSTIDIATTRSLHAVAAELEVGYLDAPVSGGMGGAQDATLTFMVGGPATLAARVEPLLQQMGSYVVHVGPGGSGQAAKIVNNMIMGACLAATCEGALLSQRLGLDAKVFYDIATRSSGDNWALRNWYPLPGVVADAPSSRGYTPGFTTDLLVKDLALALGAGDETGTPLNTARTAHGLFAASAAAGSGRRDCTALVEALDEQVTAPSVATRSS